MTSSQQPDSTRRAATGLIQLARKHKLLWAIPTLAFCVLSIVYAIAGPKKYGATQTFLVRDQLIGGDYAKPGRFESTYSLKSAQESISEIAKNPTVIRRALRHAEMSNSRKSDPNWPNDKTIEQYQGSITVSSPNGSEFGKSEMIDLVVRAGSREDALALVNSLTAEIENQLRAIRQQQADSMILETSETVRLASEDHDLAAEKLQAMEIQVGADLGELRSLNNPYSSTGSLQSQLSSVKTEIRSAINDYENLKKQQTLLRQAAMDPDRITATPDEALTLLPALKNYKEGLVRAQLLLSKNLGLFSEQHPKVISSMTEVREIQNNIAKELQSSILAKEKEAEIALAKVNRLQKTDDDLLRRLERLSRQRVQYDKLFNIVEQRSQSLTKASHELNQMKSLREAAGKVNFITRIDQAQVGTSPLGLGKRVTVGLGTLFGLFLGMGLVMFVAGGPTIAPPPIAPNAQNDRTATDTNPYQLASIPNHELDRELNQLTGSPTGQPEFANNETSELETFGIDTDWDFPEFESPASELPASELPASELPASELPASELPVGAPNSDSFSTQTPIGDLQDWDQFEDDFNDLEEPTERHPEQSQVPHTDAKDVTKSTDGSFGADPFGALTTAEPGFGQSSNDALEAEEIVIPQALPIADTSDDLDIETLLQGVDGDEPVQNFKPSGFEPPELEDIDIESRGSLNALLKSKEDISPTHSQPVTSSDSGHRPKPLPTPSPVPKSTQPTSAAAENKVKPIRLQPRKTNDPIANQDKTQNRDLTSDEQTLPPGDSKSKSVAQTLVLGTNSLLKMLEEQQKSITGLSKQDKTESEESENPASSQVKPATPKRADRGSIFVFPAVPDSKKPDQNQ